MCLRRVAILSLVAAVVLGGCELFPGETDSSGDTGPSYSVAYQPNGADGGAVPADATRYTAGDTVSVQGNTGGLTRAGYAFVGWNTDSQGTGTAYTTGATFPMPAAHVILYATWSSNPTYTVTYNANGADSGVVPVDTVGYEAGTTVTVLGNTGGLARAGYSFVGWNTDSQGNGTAYTAGATFAMPEANVTVYAAWESLFGSSIERVSIAGNGTEGNGNSAGVALSADGRYVVFGSSASNLVTGDTNGQSDIFVYDRQTDAIERVSVADDGTQGNNFVSSPAIDESGRHVVFHSPATTFLPAGVITNGAAHDIFAVDRDTDTIERVSVDDSGTEGGGTSQFPDISGDGRYVAFHSFATNLVGGDTNALGDIFVYDRQLDTIERVSVDGSGNQATGGTSRYPSLSEAGRYVAFQSDASNLVGGDTNGTSDVFVYDRQLDTIERVSVDGFGNQATGDSIEASISADGRYVAFQSDAPNLVAGDGNLVTDIFVYDRQTDTIERVSVASGGTEANGNSELPSISADGRYVAFESDATNLVTGDGNAVTDVFVYDRLNDTIRRVSESADGTEGGASSFSPAISDDGSQVAFVSEATNLVPGDTNSRWDIFVVPLF